jgi:hypothetical protein
MASVEEISMAESKERPLLIHPWVAAQLSDVWQGLKKNIEASMKMRGKSGPVRTALTKPASAHNPT